MADPKDILQCKFCEIVQGKLPAEIVFNDSVSLAFLDHRPLFPGHCLLVPKDHYETLLDLSTAMVTALFSNAQLLARLMEEALGADGSFVAVNNRISQSVPHFHIHVVPRRKKDGLKGFFWPRQKYRDQAHMTQVADAIRSRVRRLSAGADTEDHSSVHL
jgi:histidine triad (HIT) family protein